MIFDVVTLFPPMFEAVTRYGITRRAFEQGRCDLHPWNPRDFTTNAYRTVDDRPYGGGPGMVMLAEPLALALAAARARQRQIGVDAPRTVFLTPAGVRLDHRLVLDLKDAPGLILLCGRYEGVDQRLIDREVDECDGVRAEERFDFVTECHRHTA